MRISTFCLQTVFWLWGILLPGMANAAVAVLNFEINDLTPIATTEAEYQRTGSIRPLLNTALQSAGYTMIEIPDEAQGKANQGFGYLFSHPDVVAELGRAYGAEQVIVGRLHKPSFLFAYLMVKVIDVKTGTPLKEFIQEAKGESMQTTERAIKRIVENIGSLIPVTSVTPATPAVSPAATATPNERFTAPVYRKISHKPFDDVIADLLFAISQNNFRLTEHAKIGQAIAEREQVAFPRLSVLHFCNLTYAKTFIEMRPEAILHLPCRISVRQSGDEVIIETLLLENTDPAADFVTHINQLLQSIVNSGAA